MVQFAERLIVRFFVAVLLVCCALWGFVRAIHGGVSEKNETSLELVDHDPPGCHGRDIPGLSSQDNE